MKTTKLILALLCAVVIMVSCGSKSGDHASVPPVIKNKYSYALVCVSNSGVKVRILTDSASYHFAICNLHRGDKITINMNTDYYYDANVLPGDYSRTLVYYGVDSTYLKNPSLIRTLPFRPSKDTTLYQPL